MSSPTPWFVFKKTICLTLRSKVLTAGPNETMQIPQTDPCNKDMRYAGGAYLPRLDHTPLPIINHHSAVELTKSIIPV